MRVLDHVPMRTERIEFNTVSNPDPGSLQPWWTSGEVAWSNVTAYVVGDYVVRGDRIYRATANSTNAPPELAIHRDKWKDTYPVNALAWADMKSSTATRAPSPFVLGLRPGAVTDINIGGMVNVETVRVRIFVTPGPGLIYDQTFPSLYWSGDPWVSYFFDMPLQRSRLNIKDLPADAGALVELTFTGYDDEDVSVSRVALGRFVELGCPEFGLEMRLRNFGSFETDRWGNTQIRDGVVAVDLVGQGVVTAQDANRVADFVRRNRNRSMVWEASDNPVYDYLTTTGVADCSIRAEGPTHARLQFNIQGVAA